eukprot:7131174-Prymnesium_polylepis.1
MGCSFSVGHASGCATDSSFIYLLCFCRAERVNADTIWSLQLVHSAGLFWEPACHVAGTVATRVGGGTNVLAVARASECTHAL